MQPLPEALVECLKNRQAILVAGLGCSDLATLPVWGPLCNRLVDWLTDDTDKQMVCELLDRRQAATAMALLRELLLDEVVVEVLRDAYPPSTAVPEPIRAIVKAPWRGIITTGLDGIWASAVAEDVELVNRIAFAANAKGLENGRGKFLIQLFGRSDVPTSLCLAPSEIKAKIVAPGASKYLQSLHEKCSFVFVGYSPDDPDLALLAGRILGASGSALPHFFVSQALSARDARRVKAEWGMVPVALDGTLAEILAGLTEACQLTGGNPAADDVEAWLERLTAEPENEEAKEMVELGLSKLYENKEWERLVGLLVSRAELEPEAKEQAADLYEAGMVLDKELSAPERAFPVLMMALHLTPRDPGLLADAKRIAESSGQSKEFLEELHEIEKESPGTVEVGEMTLGVANMLAAEPDRRDEAIAAFQKVLDRDPDNIEAKEGLENLLRKAERYEALQALYEKALQRDPSDLDTSGKLEEIYERTQRIPQLIELLQARLARDPDEARAEGKLEALYQKGQQWQPLGALYER